MAKDSMPTDVFESTSLKDVGMTQVVDHVASKPETLSSTPVLNHLP
jgi:hypothetical protein